MRNIYVVLVVFALACQQPENPELDLSNAPDTPELFADGIISTDLYERDMAISPDKNQLIYTLGDYKQTRRCLISMTKEGSSWGKKEVLPFSGEYQDIEPFFSPDGKKLFFASDRPIFNDTSRHDYNLWFVQKEETGWTEPVALNEQINTSGNEFYPAVASSGNLYFTATREDGIGREDIFVSQWDGEKYGAPEVLDSAINTQVYEFNAYINPEENLLVFSAYGRNDGFGGGDLYFSSKDESGQWSPAKNLGEAVNSSKLDYCPYVDAEHGVFYFTSERMEVNDQPLTGVYDVIGLARNTENGFGNIYRISTDKLEFSRKRD